MQRDLLDLVYPIGRGFIDFTDNDYSNYLGFTWERELMGMFPLGANDTDYKIGDVGGSKTHTLTVEQMPSHTHIQNAHSHNVTYKDGSSASDYKPNRTNFSNGGASTFATSSVTATNQDTGGDKPFDIMPPYKTVYYWKRVG